MFSGEWQSCLKCFPESVGAGNEQKVQLPAVPQSLFQLLGLEPTTVGYIPANSILPCQGHAFQAPPVTVSCFDDAVGKETVDQTEEQPVDFE